MIVTHESRITVLSQLNYMALHVELKQILEARNIIVVCNNINGT